MRRPSSSAARVRPRSSIRKAACSWALATIRSASSRAFSLYWLPSAVLQCRHEEDRADLRRELAVVVGELDLGFEIRDCPQATDDEAGLLRSTKVHRQPVERLHLDAARQVGRLGIE